jgi:hypothetical protein
MWGCKVRAHILVAILWRQGYVSGMTPDSLKWLFDGLGAAVLVAICGFLWRRLSKKTPRADGRTSSATVQVSHNNAVALTFANGASVGAPVIIGSTITHNETHVAVQPEQAPIRKVSFPTPLEIQHAVDQTPPFQQDERRRHFIGQKVQWPVHFYSVDPARGGGYDASFYFRENYDSEMVACWVDVDEYPMLKIIKRGHVVWIRGEISQVGRGYISVRGAVLEFE